MAMRYCSYVYRRGKPLKVKNLYYYVSPSCQQVLAAYVY